MGEDEAEAYETDIPPEWANEAELIADLGKAEEIYHSLFADTEKEFPYNGYSCEGQRLELKALVDKVRAEIVEKLPEGYRFSDWVERFNKSFPTCRTIES